MSAEWIDSVEDLAPGDFRVSGLGIRCLDHWPRCVAVVANLEIPALLFEALKFPAASFRCHNEHP